jgi:hypothetical protein
MAGYFQKEFWMFPQAYIVTGHTGSYDWSREWVVAVHLNEEHAKQHVSDAQREAGELIAERNWEPDFEAPTRSDPQLCVMEGYVRYAYHAAPLVGREGLPVTGLQDWHPDRSVRSRSAGNLESAMQVAFAKLKERPQ